MTASTPCTQVFQKVDHSADVLEGGPDRSEDPRDSKVVDLMTSGNVLGEIGILTHQKVLTGAACETDVQVGVVEGVVTRETIKKDVQLREWVW